VIVALFIIMYDMEQKHVPDCLNIWRQNHLRSCLIIYKILPAILYADVGVAAFFIGSSISLSNFIPN
jgi:hypothetical protein